MSKFTAQRILISEFACWCFLIYSLLLQRLVEKLKLSFVFGTKFQNTKVRKKHNNMSMEFLRIFCRNLCKLTFFVIQIQELSTKARFSALKASCLLTQRFNYEILQVPCLDFKVNVLNKLAITLPALLFHPSKDLRSQVFLCCSRVSTPFYM